MNDNPFYRLAPFIQEYIYVHGWTELRAVQVEACRIMFDTDHHLLLATGTASGKTEAAFLPVLTLLHEAPSTTLGVLYIGPIKALINDQFLRLNDLLKEAHFPVWHWHGDVSQNHKQKLLKEPRGMLQITPESLESLLINRSTGLVRLFGDLRFIIVDEVHAFMGSDRGRQVLCQLSRLSRFIQTKPRRIGLSATLGDYTLAEDWLRSGTERQIITPNVKVGQQKIRLAIEHFYKSSESSPKDKNDKLPFDPYYKYIFDNSKQRKCLIFANNLAETESVTASLRQIAEIERLPDIYHVHHGSISAALRESAESAMRDALTPSVVAATITLELGIDIGQLERIIQLNAPFSVASFLQRLGRSGRRGNPSEMWFVCPEEKLTGKEPLPEQIPWGLLQAIAIIQLYLDERWIEPIKPVKYPFSLLYHQTMSILAAMGELTPPSLAQRVLTLPPFREISSDDFKELLVHLIKIDHIQKTEEGGLIIGLAGEQIVRNFRFYAVFQDNDEYNVKEDSKEIGSIIYPPPLGERFALAGRTWEVLEIDLKSKVIFVKLVKGRATVSWRGSGGDIHTRILKCIREVLFEDVQYNYLQNQAQERLKEARWLAQNAGLDRDHIFHLGGDTYCIFPWMGSVPFRTLERYLHHLCKSSSVFKIIDRYAPYYFTIKIEQGGAKDIHKIIMDMGELTPSSEILLDSEETPRFQKYDEFIPPNLLRKAYLTDYLNFKELQEIVRVWR
ncbi:MAG: Helicase domain protein [Candidatus Jettenia ecosi]|uniref:Helicase domain protein n=1 Tax=Candidatus Jettenia ecosi TaxID=2494326 RepID=A0A533QB23_9BACT|nr:MAG: Helicase domain protein [Candidatus Jettenia ecosi]